LHALHPHAPLGQPPDARNNGREGAEVASITKGDALAEGIVHDASAGYNRFHVPGIEHPNKKFPELSRTNAREMYAALWDRINGSGAWLENPWVWALIFKVHHQNVDSFLQTREAA
jgi:hypothetical protein